MSCIPQFPPRIVHGLALEGLYNHASALHFLTARLNLGANPPSGQKYHSCFRRGWEKVNSHGGRWPGQPKAFVICIQELLIT